MKSIINILIITILSIMVFSCKKERVAPQNIVSISASNTHTLLLFENGDVYCTGNNDANPSIDKTQFRFLTSNIKKIKACWSTSLILSNENQLLSCGRSIYYSLASDRNTTNTFVNAWQYLATCEDFDANHYSLFVSNRSTVDGRLYFRAAGDNRMGAIKRSWTFSIPMLTEPNDTIRKVFLGRSSVFMNHNYNNTNNIFYAIGGGEFNGKSLGVGLGLYGAAHVINFVGLYTNNTPLDVKKISSDEFGYNTLLLTNDGRLFAAGDNNSGQLGTNDNVSHEYFTYVTDNVKDIATGRFHSMILKNDNSVWVCGSNFNGALGFLIVDKLNTFTKVFENARLIEAGGESSFIVSNENRLYAAGLNDNHQLGISNMGTETKISIFKEVPIDIPL
jgi:alpha-tubulin suppressor-like RCC1 family protein